MREIEEARGQTVNRIEAPNDSFAEKFVQQGIREVASVLAKYGVDHDTVLAAELPKGSKPTDAQIAHTLGQIEVFDDNLKHPDMSTDDGLVQAAIVTEAKRIALAKSTNNRRLKERLEGFGDKVLDNVGGVIARLWGRKGLTTVLAITTIIATACGSSGIMPIVPIVVDEGGNGRPTPTLSAPLPTETKQKPTITAVVPTYTPTPRPTITKEPPTATKEVAQFSVCSIEQYKDCRISVEDLYNGNYLNWLNTLSKPFDPKKIRTDINLIYYTADSTKISKTDEISFQENLGPKFTGPNAGKEPFRRDVTFGVTSYMGHNYLVMPVEFYDPAHPDKNAWVITVAPLYTDHNFSDEEVKTGIIDVWKKDMNTTPIVASTVPFMAPASDLLAEKTFNGNPNLRQDFIAFSDYGPGGKGGSDRSALSKKGYIFLNLIVTNSGGWYQ